MSGALVWNDIYVQFGNLDEHAYGSFIKDILVVPIKYVNLSTKHNMYVEIKIRLGKTMNLKIHVNKRIYTWPSIHEVFKSNVSYKHSTNVCVCIHDSLTLECKYYCYFYEVLGFRNIWKETTFVRKIILMNSG